MHRTSSHPPPDPSRPLSDDTRQLATAVRATLTAHPERLWLVLGVLDHLARPDATAARLTVAIQTLTDLAKGGDEQ